MVILISKASALLFLNANKCFLSFAGPSSVKLENKADLGFISRQAEVQAEALLLYKLT